MTTMDLTKINKLLDDIEHAAISMSKDFSDRTCRRLSERRDLLLDEIKKQSESSPCSLVSVKKERDGWMDRSKELEKRLGHSQLELDSMRSFDRKDAWFWQGDGYDNLQSMTNQLVVVIHARQLNGIIDKVYSAGVEVGYEFRSQFASWFPGSDSSTYINAKNKALEFIYKGNKA